MALGALKYLKSADYEVPGKVGLMGFSNWMLSEYISPSLSSVDQHGFEMGERATEILINLIKEHSLGEDDLIEMKTELIVRQSSQKRL